MTNILILASIFLFAQTGKAASKPARSAGYINDLHGKIKTPHRVICDKYARKGLKALCIVPYQLGSRSVLEAAERFPFKYNVVTTSSEKLDFHSEHHYNYIAKRFDIGLKTKLKELKKKLQGDFDLIVIGVFKFGSLPDDIMEKILDKVKKGTGLVVCGKPMIPDYADGLIMSDYANKKSKFILRETPLAFLPAYKGISPDKVVKCYKYGEGKIVFLWTGVEHAYNGAHAFTPMDGIKHFDSWDNNYEMYMSLFLKCALYAAGKSPDVIFSKPKFDFKKSPAKIKLTFTAASTNNLNYRVKIYDPEGKVEFSNEGKIQKTAKEITIPIPLLKLGNHFFECRIFNSKNELENWGYWGFKVKGRSVIKNITTTKARFMKGENVTGSVNFNSSLTGTVSVSLIDNWGREVARKISNIEDKKNVKFSIQAINNPSIRYRIAANFANESIRDEKKISFLLNYDGRSKFRAISWGGFPTCRLGAMAEKFLYDAGWTAMLHGKNNWKQNMFSVIPAMNLTDISRFDTPAEIAGLKKALKKGVSRGTSEPTFAYTLGDETRIGRSVHSSLAGVGTNFEKRFPAYLKKHYGDIKRLNIAWHTKFKNFDAVIPIKINLKHVPARWIVFRKFISEQFMDLHKTAVSIVRQSDPGAAVGIEGSDYIAAGSWFNPFRLYRETGMWAPYASYFYSMILRSIRQADKPYGTWFGGYTGRWISRYWYDLRSPETKPYLLWKHMMDGANSMWWFKANGLEGFFNRDMDFNYFYKYIREDVALISSSLGPVITQAKYAPDKVAVIYSYSSKLAALVSPQNQNFHHALGFDLIMAMWSAGIQPVIINEDDLPNGKASLDGFKLVFLPYNTAMSDEVMDKLITAAKKGATIAAAMDVAIMDENGLPRKQSKLNKVFGVASAINPKCPSTTLKLNYKGNFLGSDIQLSIPKLLVGTSVKPDSGKSAINTKQAIFIRNKYGKGEGILFNCQLSAGNNLSKPEIANISKVWKALAKHCEINQVAEIKQNARDKSIYELSTFKNGNATILGIQRTIFYPNEKKAILVKLNQKYDVFDILRGVHIGKTDSIKVKLSGTRAGFYSLFPAKVENWQVKLSSDKATPGSIIKLAIKVSPANEFRDRYSVSIHKKGVSYNDDPNKGICSWWRVAKVKEKEKCEIIIPVAYNEKSGDYIISLRRDMTGETKLFKLKVISK